MGLILCDATLAASPGPAAHKQPGIDQRIQQQDKSPEPQLHLRRKTRRINHRHQIMLDETAGITRLPGSLTQTVLQGRQRALQVQHFHRQDWPYHVVTPGEEISLGKRTLSFLETRMLHWPDSMFTYLKEDQILFTSDAFGEHLATSDRGIVMLRRMLLKQLDTVAAGGDPAGVQFDADAPPVHFTSGNFMLD